VTQLFFHDVVR